MSKFHSTLSRREFMKAMGLAGAGLGAAAATAPVFHDMDEVLSSTPASEWKNPWWVKERDYEDPTVEVDWDVYPGTPFRDSDWQDQEEAKTMDLVQQQYGSTDRDVLNKQWAQQEVPGMCLRDVALNDAATCCDKGLSDRWSPISLEDLGVPKWQGTPEENLHMMRVASRFFGSYWSGAAELNSKNVKCIEAGVRGAFKKNVVHRDVSEYQTTDAEIIIPNGWNYVYTWVMQHPQLGLSTSPGMLTNPYGYFFVTNTKARVESFIQNLGYGVGVASVGTGAFPTLTGVTEMTRQGANVIVPSHGAMPRRTETVVTDLPLAYSRPVDSGIYRFCHTCKKCAETCLTGSISMEDEPSWEVRDRYMNIPGLKHFYLNYSSCGPWKSRYAPGYCGMCLSVCVFRNFNEALIHPIIQAVTTNTPIFNSFFRQMDDIFGYRTNLMGNRAHTEDDTVEQFWNTIGPEHGFLTHFGSHG